MKTISYAVLILVCLSSQTMAQTMLPSIISGRLERIENFRSEYVPSRNIDIWLPEGYPSAGKYAVLYMQDGQMLFDPATTWNNQAWNIDDVASILIKSNKVKPFIVVGISNGGEQRHAEYFPQKAFDMLSNSEKDSVSRQLEIAGRTKSRFEPFSDNYLKFLVRELKPFVDNKYNVSADRQSCFIAGSSMGALISLYAVCEYPEVFGGAACLSTHWPGIFSLENNPVPNSLIKYLSQYLPAPGKHKFYFDCGDRTLDALYPSIQRQVDALMIQKGYDRENLLSQYYPGEEHSEKSWSKRLDKPLSFLLKAVP